mmetsp:Transcript_39881/g.127809  ORF Transcript_39881/g.127809 Transcript_39881/m.127809 type:complete len:561 (+) Transcript_39881:106-1788(+)
MASALDLLRSDSSVGRGRQRSPHEGRSVPTSGRLRSPSSPREGSARGSSLRARSQPSFPASDSRLRASPSCRARAWLGLTPSGSGDSKWAIFFSASTRAPQCIELGEVVGMDIHLHAERTLEVWGGRLLVARRVPRKVTWTSSVALVLHFLLLVLLFLFTFEVVGPMSATVVAGRFAWLVYSFQTPRPDRKQQPYLDPALSWWYDFAIWWCIWQLPGFGSARLYQRISMRCSAVALAAVVLCWLHGCSLLVLPLVLPRRCLECWHRGGLFLIHDGLARLASPDWWPQVAPPVVVDFPGDELADLIALRAAIWKSGYQDLLTHTWVGNQVVESALSVVMPTPVYNSRALRFIIHIVLNLCLPLFFCFQAFHILLSFGVSLNLPLRWQNDPFVRLMNWVDQGFRRSWEHRQLTLPMPAVLTRALDTSLRRLCAAIWDLFDWLAAVAMPVDYFVTYFQARLNSLRVAFAPLGWALHPIWLFLRQRIFWGVPGFMSLGWWRQAVASIMQAKASMTSPTSTTSTTTMTTMPMPPDGDTFGSDDQRKDSAEIAARHRQSRGSDSAE